MQRLVHWSALALAFAIVPRSATAQRRATAQHSMEHEMKHEVGFDIALVYSKPSGSPSAWGFVTPVDVRFGFVSHSSLMFEPRVSLQYLHSNGVSLHNFNLDLNAIYNKDHKKGMYLTGGAGIDLVGVTGGNSGSQFSLNGGVGTRIPYESGAWRIEGFLKYDLKNTSLGLPNTVNIGVRAGLSLWH
jgi:hypothetical protein